MSQLLVPGQVIRTEASAMECMIEQCLGGGGQGEVYRAALGGTPVAIKWYYPHYLQEDSRLRERLERVIRNGPPSDRFLWPLELASAAGTSTFGYVMALRESRFKGILDMMTGRADPSFRTLTTVGFELANSYLQLHAQGLCYRDISFGNVFFDPTNGEVRICDNDNVDVNGQPGAITGTPDFMAPEIVRNEAFPSTSTDLYSLSVLLFYIFHVCHPLQGKKMMDVHAFDLPARQKLFGREPVFIFDPVDQSNKAVSRAEDPEGDGESGANALLYWPIYPQFLRDLFTRAFTDGVRNPENGRVAENIWRQAMIRLRDSIVYCPSCGKENFYDAEALRAPGGQPAPCCHCQKAMKLPARIRVNRHIVMLNHDTKLYPHHVDEERMYDFSRPVAEMARHPSDPNLWGIKNLSTVKWTSIRPDGTMKDIEPGRSVALGVGSRIHFGKSEGEIRMG